jgi:HPt (histidine-containing phosphotransfer) domain-containing protein
MTAAETTAASRIKFHTSAGTRNVIDVNDGIDRIMGDRALYARMLKRFRSDYAAGAGPIRSALASGDRILAHRISHTLKGAAGMIGAHRLHNHACALEIALRTCSGAEAIALDALAPAFERALQVIDTLLSGTAVMPEPEPPTRLLLPDSVLLEKLVELLIDGDGAAIDLLEESNTSLKAILGNARLEEVVAAANEFDYERALLALRRVAGAA